MGLGGLRRAQAAIPPGMTRYLFSKRLGGTQGHTGRVRKILAPPEFDHRTVQPIASLCTD